MRKTSIVILTYNKLDYTKICLESIRRYTWDYEIIVVDNGSTDGTPAWLQTQKDITIILNAENKGFAGGCNQGIVKSTGDVIVLLNNDTIVTPRWLDNLLICLNSSEKIGAAAVCSNNEIGQNLVQADGRIDNLIAFADNFNQSNPKLWAEDIRLIGFCLAIKKSVIDEIGLLDEQFFPGNFEDDDYCLRMHLAGYKLIFCRDTFVHHYHNISTANDPGLANKLAEIIPANQQKFLRKWGFYAPYHCEIKTNIINMINPVDRFRNIRVLEIGCACGGTLLKIKHL
ncbi:MAG: glycosyltransferase family 2 protein, partial [Sporomusaceae bacterium]|nr:glycosyltransferase family 2 protein [Sporomusaceae bacterium]